MRDGSFELDEVDGTLTPDRCRLMRRGARSTLERERRFIEKHATDFFPSMTDDGSLDFDGPHDPLDRVATPPNLQRAGAALRALHTSRIVHGELYSWRLWVPHDLSTSVKFSGLFRARALRRLTRRQRYRDVATLLATLPHESEMRDALIAGYGTISRPRLLDRLVIRVRGEGLAPRSYPFLQSGERWAHPICREFLDDADWITRGDYARLRRKQERENGVLGVSGFEMFLKIHPLGAEGRGEWARHALLKSLGIETPVPAIAGTVHGKEVFATFKIPEGRPLDRALRDDHLLDRERRTLASRLGTIVRRMHGHGLCHRDLYLCHVFSSGAGLRLIDLQRVEAYTVLSRRRRIKDLAALLYSSRAATVSALERLRLLRAYLGPSWKRQARAWIRRITSKANQIERHAGPPQIG